MINCYNCARFSRERGVCLIGFPVKMKIDIVMYIGANIKTVRADKECDKFRKRNRKTKGE